LRSFPDSRGFFREIFRRDEPIFGGGEFAQWSHSLMQKDVVKAWHYHHLQTDWWYVPAGGILTVLFDNRPESPTHRAKISILMGDGGECPGAAAVCARIPPGVLHGCRVLTAEAHLIYITSRTYDPNEEGRFPFDADFTGHDWGEGAITAENDRRTFAPTAARAPLAAENGPE